MHIISHSSVTPSQDVFFVGDGRQVYLKLLKELALKYAHAKTIRQWQFHEQA
ncbi:MAG: hypothetical protein U9Q07_14230 [Planctomycetota bacterium]|nr:hypothetical protein [Planctomycetota bacterium]